MEDKRLQIKVLELQAQAAAAAKAEQQAGSSSSSASNAPFSSPPPRALAGNRKRSVPNVESKISKKKQAIETPSPNQSSSSSSSALSSLIPTPSPIPLSSNPKTPTETPKKTKTRGMIVLDQANKTVEKQDLERVIQIEFKAEETGEPRVFEVKAGMDVFVPRELVPGRTDGLARVVKFLPDDQVQLKFAIGGRERHNRDVMRPVKVIERARRRRASTRT